MLMQKNCLQSNSARQRPSKIDRLQKISCNLR
jgi:hypothetical protein